MSEGSLCSKCGSTIQYVGDGMWIDRFRSETCPGGEELHWPTSYPLLDEESQEGCPIDEEKTSK